MRNLSKFATAVAATLLLAFGAAGCNKQSDNAAQPQQEQQDLSYDPASANMAPADQSAPANESASSSGSARTAQPQPSSQTTVNTSDDVPPPPPDENTSYPTDNTVPPTEVSSDQSGYYDDSAFQQPVYASQAPPPLPDYQQPAAPGPNYLWTPGYWGYQPTGYYWVPGVWVIAPYVGALWTPGYWGWGNNRYLWNHGYWGPHIGYYGGINYGHGYVGNGYYGGYWNRNNFYYNRTITNVNTTVVKNVYVHNVTINNVTINNYNNNRISYNGGHGGIQVRPTPAELQASRERHLPPLTAQTMHARQAGQDRAQFFDVNHGRPQAVAANRPLATSFHAPAAQPPARGVANPGFVEHTATVHPVNRPEAPPQHAGTRPGAVTELHAEPQAPVPQHPNLIRPQAHSQDTHAEARPEARPAPVQREQARPQPEQRPVAVQHPQPEQRPEAQSEQIRPQQQHSAPQQRPEVQHQEPRAQQEAHPVSRQEMHSEPQSRPQQEKPHPIVRQETHTEPHAEQQPHGKSR